MRAIGINFLSSVGDIVVSWAALAALKKKYPGIEIDVFVPKGERELYEICPDVSNIYSFDNKKSKGIFRGINKALEEFGYCRKLAANRYDIGFVFDLKDASVCKLFAINPALKAYSNGSKLAGTINFVKKQKAINRNAETGNMRMQRYIDVLNYAGIELDYGSTPHVYIRQEDVFSVAAKLNIVAGSKIYVHCPFGSALYKEWPIEKHREIILKAQRYGYFDRMFVIGTANRKADIEKMTEGTIAEPVAGTFGIKGAASLISMADLFVTVDTGPMHIAAALDKNMLVLFPHDDFLLKEWRPWNENVTLMHSPPGKDSYMNFDMAEIAGNLSALMQRLMDDQSRKEVGN